MPSLASSVLSHVPQLWPSFSVLRSNRLKTGSRFRWNGGGTPWKHWKIGSSERFIGADAPQGASFCPRSQTLEKAHTVGICGVSWRRKAPGLSPACRRRKLHILRFAFRGKSSVVPLLLLSPPNPLRWALAGPPFCTASAGLCCTAPTAANSLALKE